MKKIICFLILILSVNAAVFAAGGGDRLYTDYNINNIKDYLNSGNLNDEREGIYIQSRNGGSNPYLLAIIKNVETDEFCGIYLSGPGGSEWKEGNIKLIFKTTDRGFRGTWFSRSGIYGDNAELMFNYNYSFMIKTGTFWPSTYYFSKIMPYAGRFHPERIQRGTGFLLNTDGYVVTNQHVIENKNYFLVRGINGNPDYAYWYTPVLIDEYNDIAILKPEVTFLTFSNLPYRFGSGETRTGDSVFALGYPQRELFGEEITLTNGIISSLSGFRGNLNQYQMTTPINPGNSGGPLFNEKGEIIGINTAGLNPAYFVNANYAVKIEYVLELIKNSGLHINTHQDSNIRVNSPSTNSSLADMTARVKDFVYMIEAF